jgi:hypothetical protein
VKNEFGRTQQTFPYLKKMTFAGGKTISQIERQLNFLANIALIRQNTNAKASTQRMFFDR